MNRFVNKKFNQIDLERNRTKANNRPTQKKKAHSVKFQNWVSFEKHLSEATPKHLSSLYLAVTACAYERKKIFGSVLQAIQKKEPHASITRFEAAHASIEEVMEQLRSQSLFGGPSIVQLDGVEKLKKQSLEVLIAYVEAPSPFSYLILGANSGKQVASLIQKGKKNLVTLDLSDEKPWDKKTRLQAYLARSASQEGKALSSDAALHLLEHVGLDLPALEQEMTKLLCYCAERKQITLEDVRKVGSSDKQINTWQLAEAIIWEKAPVALEEQIELSWLLPFIGQLRYQLHIGIQLASCLERHFSSEEISVQFPQIRGALLSKRLSVVRHLGRRFFQKALHELFEIELLTKNHACNPALALDLFISKIRTV